jgi:CDP-glucose 4,6-dehydratase
MDWNGKKVLVTGASGFVGSWLTKALIEKGADVTALSWGDISKSVLGFENMLDRLKFVKCDIRNYDDIKKVLDENSVEVLFHLAAQAIVGQANVSPIPTLQVNIQGTWNVLEAARNSKSVETVVGASTDKVYGEPVELPIRETHPLLAKYPYDTSKACADMLSRMYFEIYKLPIALTRCCNIYGGGDLNWSRIVPETVRAVILDRSPVLRSDGSPVRDFIHVDDAVNAYITLAENVHRKEVQGRAFNFGSNSPISILELVKKIIEISGKQLEPDIQGKGTPTGEISKEYLASDNAEKILDWRPQVNLEDGIKKTIDWYRRYFEWNPDAKEQS